MPATAQIAGGFMDEGRVVLWMGEGCFGRCQIDENILLAEASAPLPRPRDPLPLLRLCKRVPLRRSLCFTHPGRRLVPPASPTYAIRYLYIFHATGHITALTTASIPSSARLVSPIGASSSWHSLPRPRVSPATCNRAVWRHVGANRTAVPVCGALTVAGGARKYVSSRRVRVVYLDPLLRCYRGVATSDALPPSHRRVWESCRTLMAVSYLC